MRKRTRIWPGPARHVTILISGTTSGDVVQLVRTPACHVGGRGFEPRRPRQFLWIVYLPSTHLFSAHLARDALSLIHNGIEKTHMESSQRPDLRFLHSQYAMSHVKLAAFRRLSTDAIKFSLNPGQPGALKVRPDGTVLDGHHRLSILVERGENIDQLPREIMDRES